MKNSKFKRITSVVLTLSLAVGLVFSLSACGDKTDGGSGKNKKVEVSEENLQAYKDFIITADKVLSDYMSPDINPDKNITEPVGSYKNNEVVVFPKHNFKIVENRNNYFYTRSALQSEMYRRGNIIFDNFVGYVKDENHNDKRGLKITENSTFNIVSKDELKDKYSLDLENVKKYYATTDKEAEKSYVYVLVSLSSEEKTMSTYSTIYELEVINNNGNDIYYIHNSYLIKDGSFDFEQTKVVRPVSLIENYNNEYVKREMELIRAGGQQPVVEEVQVEESVEVTE